LDFQLPNVFTPNGDDVNDEFKPKRTPSLVNNVEIKVYNRWGIKVFESNEINFSWDGNQATDGLYYYIARVKFNTQNGLEKDFKGWVQLIR
jgi:gliding motility-associated-like protein